MKKHIYLIIGLVFPIIAFGQLQNLNFEQWEQPVQYEIAFKNAPTGWVCSNRWLGTEFSFLTPTFNLPVDSHAQDGDYAISLFIWYNYVKDAALQIAPINTRPEAVKGHFKYIGNTVVNGNQLITDTAEVRVWLTKWNTNTNQRDTIGKGLFATHTETLNYHEFKAEILYTTSETPDSIILFLDPSIVGRDINNDFIHLGLQHSSNFIVDNLSLIFGGAGTTSLKETEVVNSLTVYPNPATTQLTVEHHNGSGIITDVSGKTIKSINLSTSKNIDISTFHSGIYFIQIQNEDGIFRTKFVVQ